MNTVECRSDSTFAERPLSLMWEGVRYEIAEIVSALNVRPIKRDKAA